MKVFYFNIEALRDRKVFEQQLSVMPEGRKQKVLKYSITADKLRSLAAGILIKFIKKQYGVNSDVEYDKHGKPYFVRGEVKFNISHSGRFVVAAVSDYEVGIDIQAIKADKHRIAEKNFSKAECTYINEGADDKARQQRFCEIWTMKEAYLKNIGLGLRKPLKSFQIVLGQEPTVKGKSKYAFKQFKMNNKYVVSVCSHKKDQDLLIQEVGLE